MIHISESKIQSSLPHSARHDSRNEENRQYQRDKKNYDCDHPAEKEKRGNYDDRQNQIWKRILN